MGCFTTITCVSNKDTFYTVQLNLCEDAHYVSKDIEGYAIHFIRALSPYEAIILVINCYLLIVSPQAKIADKSLKNMMKKLSVSLGP